MPAEGKRTKKKPKKKSMKNPSLHQIMKKEGKKLSEAAKKTLQTEKPKKLPSNGVKVLAELSDDIILGDNVPASDDSNDEMDDCDSMPEPISCKVIDASKSTKSESDFMKHATSTERGEAALSWMISPVTIEQFYSEYFEEKPFLLERKKTSYYRNLLTTAEFDKILHENFVYFGKNIDLTSYVDGERETHNLNGRALPGLVWDSYAQGCSVRMLNPQSYSQSVYELCSVLAETFSSFVGANLYLTPADTQGFAPHWDDIDAFVIQLEGSKRWKLYSHTTEDNRLPLESSGNLTREELGPIVLDHELHAGDLLYIPRGVVHEAECSEKVHSLHITISVNQKNSWADYLKILLPAALETATRTDVDFRRTLPRNYMSTMGLMHSEDSSGKRDVFSDRLKGLLGKLMRYAPVDDAFDQMASNYFRDALPPVVSSEELAQSSQTKCKWSTNGLPSVPTMNAKSSVRLAGKNVCRIVAEDEDLKLFYTTDNTKVYRENEEPFMPIEENEACAIEALIHCYPAWTKVSDLPSLASEEDKVDLASMLYLKGILLSKCG